MFKRVGISQKIYAAFGVLIIVIAVVGGAGFLGIQAISQLFSAYRASTGELLMTSQIVSNVNDLQKAALRYQRDRNDDAIKAFATAMKSQLVFKKDSADAFAASESATTALG